MKGNLEKLKTVITIDFLSVVDDIWGCCRSAAFIGEPPLVITSYYFLPYLTV